MIARIVKLYIDKEKKSDFIALFDENKNLIKNTRGCLHLDLLTKEEEDAQIFITFSKWEKQDDLDNYRNSEVFGKIWPKTKAWFVKKPEATSYDLLTKSKK